jgi:hypothetical protein
MRCRSAATVITATCIAPAAAQSKNAVPRCVEPERDTREAAGVRGDMPPVNAPGEHGTSNKLCKR